MNDVKKVLEILRANDYMGVSKADVVTDLVGCGYPSGYARSLIESYCEEYKPFNWRKTCY